MERMSERTTSDQEFVRLFSPKILERLAEDAFEGAIHIFRSPPGGGKTTLLRAFTPTALRAFWNARHVQEMNEAYQGLLARQIMHEQHGPTLLGVLLSCASGYADLPASVDPDEGLFRSLLNCRIVLRTLRNLGSLLGLGSQDELNEIQLTYAEAAQDLKSIPRSSVASELLRWAEQRERGVYLELDSVGSSAQRGVFEVRFEGVLWLQSVSFLFKGNEVAPKRLLMVDDLHKLRRKQRELLLRELTEMRPSIPIWLSERNIALGEELLSQGAREGRELRQYSLEELWSSSRGQHQFANYAQNILDRRLDAQNLIPVGSFSQYLAGELRPSEIERQVSTGINSFREEVKRHSENTRYSEWLRRADELITQADIDALRDLYVTRILLIRDEAKRQLSLNLVPLSSDELEDRESSQVLSAVEIFMNEELKIPYYFGIDRLCVLATNNVEELLSLAAALYEGILARQILRKPDLLLSPSDQEKLLKEAARRKREFIPKNHTEGSRAQRLLDSIGSYCRERTFLPNAPYAPGVTGVRLSISEMERVKPSNASLTASFGTLRRVLAECIAENLLFIRPSSASTSREGGTILYLNRTLCGHYGLPLQLGGWQDLTADTLVQWMERGRTPAKQKPLEIGE